MFTWKLKSIWKYDAACYNEEGNVVCRYTKEGTWYKPIYIIESREDQWQIIPEGLGLTHRLYLWDVPIGEYRTKITSGDPIEIGTSRYIWKWKMKGFLGSSYQILDAHEEKVLIRFEPKMRWSGKIDTLVHCEAEMQESTEFGLLLGLGWHLAHQNMASGAA
jgi:hypothetical protein